MLGSYCLKANMGGVLAEVFGFYGASCAVQYLMPPRSIILITGLDSLAQKLVNMSLHIQASYFRWHYCILFTSDLLNSLCRLRL